MNKEEYEAQQKKDFELEMKMISIKYTLIKLSSGIILFTLVAGVCALLFQML